MADGTHQARVLFLAPPAIGEMCLIRQPVKVEMVANEHHSVA